MPAVGPPSKGRLGNRSLALLLSCSSPPDTSPIRGVDGDDNLVSWASNLRWRGKRVRASEPTWEDKEGKGQHRQTLFRMKVE